MTVFPDSPHVDICINHLYPEPKIKIFYHEDNRQHSNGEFDFQPIRQHFTTQWVICVSGLTASTKPEAVDTRRPSGCRVRGSSRGWINCLGVISYQDGQFTTHYTTSLLLQFNIFIVWLPDQTIIPKFLKCINK